MVSLYASICKKNHHLGINFQGSLMRESANTQVYMVITRWSFKTPISNTIQPPKRALSFSLGEHLTVLEYNYL